MPLEDTNRLAETLRMRAVRRYAMEGEGSDPELDAIARLAADVFGAPLAAVTIVDRDLIRFRGRFGFDAESVSRSIGLCSDAIQQSDAWVVEDTCTDPRTGRRPIPLAGAEIRSYAGAPLRTCDGYNLGMISILDTVPRQMDAAGRKRLKLFAAVVVDVLELRLLAHTRLIEREEMAAQRRDCPE